MPLDFNKDIEEEHRRLGISEEPNLCPRCEENPVDKVGEICGACVDEINHN